MIALLSKFCSISVAIYTIICAIRREHYNQGWSILPKNSKQYTYNTDTYSIFDIVYDCMCRH